MTLHGSDDVNLLRDKWREYAECRDEDPWYWARPIKRGPRTKELEITEEYAKSVCHNKCPVREECELAGIDAPGIWGGYTEKERQARSASRHLTRHRVP